MKFFFVCKKCGQYEVGKATFSGLLTPAIENLLQKKEQEGASSVVAEFEFDCCPRCKPKGESAAKIKIPKKVT